MKTDTRVLRTIRPMAWERAKGELHSMIHTFWSENDAEFKQYEDFKNVVKKFISEVEDGGLHE